MKKFFTIVSVLSFSLSLFAQTSIQKFQLVQKELTKEGKVVAISLTNDFDYTTNEISILDSNFNETKSFTAKNLTYFYYQNWDTNSFWLNSGEKDEGYIKISQTFFNDDDKWEYVSKDRSSNDYFVMNEDGDTLITLKDVPSSRCGFLLEFNAKKYILFQGQDYKTFAIYEVQNNGSTSASRVTDSTKACRIAGVFNLNGQNVPNMSKGAYVVHEQQSNSKSSSRKILVK